jgi:Tol biopolymer transport system component
VKGHCLASWPRFSSDGKTLITTDREGKRTWAADGWKATSRRPLAEGESTTSHRNGGGDGTFYIETKDYRAYLCATATGKRVWELKEAKYVYVGLISEDNHRVMVWADWDIIRLYDTRTGKQTGVITLKGHEGYPTFSRDGKRVAWAAKDNSVRLFDGTTGKPLATLRSYAGLPVKECDDATVNFCPTGRQVAVTALHGHRSFSSSLDEQRRTTFPTRVFDADTGRQIARFYTNPEKKEKAAPPSCSAWSPDGRLLAFAEKESGLIRLLEAASGQVRATFDGHKHGVHGLAFSPDGRLLASGGEDNIGFVWDVVGPASGGWVELASDDGKRSSAAVAAFVRMGKRGVALLKERLRPAPAVDGKRLARLIAGLVSDDFDTRETSSRDLAALGEQAGPAMHRMRQRTEDLEMRLRLDKLLVRLERSPPAEELRALRGVEALERIGTREAVNVIAALAKGAPDARLTLEAKAAMGRLSGPRPR